MSGLKLLTEGASRGTAGLSSGGLAKGGVAAAAGHDSLRVAEDGGAVVTKLRVWREEIGRLRGWLTCCSIQCT